MFAAAQQTFRMDNLRSDGVPSVNTQDEPTFGLDYNLPHEVYARQLTAMRKKCVGNRHCLPLPLPNVERQG